MYDLGPKYVTVGDRSGAVMESAFRTLYPMVKPVVKGAYNTAAFISKSAFTTAPHVARYGLWHASRAANVMLKNPALTLGLGAAAGAASLLNKYTGGPGETRGGTKGMSRYLQMTGQSSTGFELGQGPDRAGFIASTEGLVQGLHAGRHR